MILIRSQMKRAASGTDVRDHPDAKEYDRMKSGETPSRFRRLPLFTVLPAIVPAPRRNRTANLSYFMRSMPETALLRKGLGANNARDFARTLPELPGFEI
ncbi:hypothetical protein F2981_03245 [Sinorhizobium meliloti]|nr:hypothetical protein [Sinorhizobium meliloti]